MSKTITIIKLLNKIANGEEVPKKVKYEREIYNFKEIDYKNENRNLYLFTEELQDITSVLNDTVEIIEEQEEIDIQELEDVNLFDNGQNFNDMPIIIKWYDDNFTNINNTINKLVQAVKQLDKNIKEK